MFEKDKKYTYEEITKIVMEASAKLINDLDEKSNGLGNEVSQMIFKLQNQMVITQFCQILLKGDKDEDN